MSDNLYSRIREILDSARSHVARSVNSTQVAANWLIGREIVEEEQQGKKRADYGKRLIAKLSSRLTKDLGRGFTIRNLESFRVFYQEYPALLKAHAVRAQFATKPLKAIPHALRAQSGTVAIELIPHASHAQPPRTDLSVSPRGWKPGQLHPNLSWTHYRTLLRVDDAAARSFYEIEAIKQAWPARGLERQGGTETGK